MAIHWRELLDLANAIAAGMKEEAARRTAASRAYYAAFHCANAYLGIEGYTGHRAVVEALLSSQSNRDVAAGRMLNQAMRRRVKADYRLSQGFTDQDMRACMGDATRVVNMLGG